ncbi:MAG: ATP-binding protein [Bacteroidia bacterium]|nr:ATP-binding protein [Bacteroidia bacterium]
MESRPAKSILKIALVGAESSGKTTLARELAQHFNTVWVPEFLRSYFVEKGGILKAEDTPVTILGQLDLEKNIAKSARGYLFCDTCPLQSLVYYRHYFGEIPPELMPYYSDPAYDLYLLLLPDLGWENDLQRESAEVQKKIHQDLEKELIRLNLPFVRIEGRGRTRLEAAVKAIEQFFHKKTGP